LAQLRDPLGDPVQEWPPALELLKAEIRDGGCTAAECQARLIGDDQADVPAI